MLLTAPLLSKSTFFGSLLNKCRPALVDLTNNISTTAANFKTIEEQVGLPPRPKRPMTPYFRYLRDMRPKLMAENPKINTKDVVRQLSKSWATVGPNERQRFQEEYKRDHLVYIEQRTKYDAKITDEQRAEITHIKQKKTEAREKRHMRARVKELGRPKRPASAFLRFIQAERVSTPQLPKQTYKEWHEKCVAKWTRLSDAEKAAYMKEARNDLEKYKKNMIVWEERMMKLGNMDVIRAGNLIDPPEPKQKKR